MKALKLFAFIASIFVQIIFFSNGAAASKTETYIYDYVVYGGTAGGAISAIAAANEGLHVALLEPKQHIGGMVSGGLGATDKGKAEVIGGLSREFFERCGKHYGKFIQWRFEPHVAEKVLLDWLSDAGVDLFTGHTVYSVEKYENHILSIKTENGKVFKGKIFADASYEGDLLPRAGISYTWGREGKDDYGESLAGRREFTKNRQFYVPFSAFEKNDKFLRLIYTGDPGKLGEGDHKVQAYNFRLCLTNRKDNMVPFPKPPIYDPLQYELLKRYLEKLKDTIKLPQIWSMNKLPNGKIDLNNSGFISTDYIGGSWEYPEADYKRRAEIWKEHKYYIQGFLYFLANDSSVPKHLQEAVNQWGLAKDEFIDNSHWPYQLYIREARRMIGEYVMTQADLQKNLIKTDSIGMGSYNSDSHSVQRIPASDGTRVVNEGNILVHVQPYEIPYRSIVPKASECDNLLVLSCFSASHVAYSSMRMEPQYMIIGHAGGISAKLAIMSNSKIQYINIEELQNKLRKQNQVLCYQEKVIKKYNKEHLQNTGIFIVCGLSAIFLILFRSISLTIHIKYNRIMRLFGFMTVIFALMANPFILSFLFSPDRHFEYSTNLKILTAELILAVSGIAIYSLRIRIFIREFLKKNYS